MRLAAWLCLLLAAAAASAEGIPSDAELAQLSAEVEKHPDDVALMRALARAHLERDEVEPALTVLHEFDARHPEQHGAIAQVLGRALYLKGELGGARVELEQAIEHRTDDALAHFYLGLVLLKGGDPDGAARELRLAGEYDPALMKQTRRPREPARWPAGHFTFMGGSGIEFDTNPTIEGEEGSAPSQGDDFRLVYNAGLSTQLLRTEASALSANYRFDGSRHDELGELDLMVHSFGLGGVHAFDHGVFLRLDGGAGLQDVDHDRYLDSLSVAPALGFQLGERGVLQLRGVAEQRDFADEPALASLERDGWRYAGVLSHSLPVRRWSGARFTTQLQYARTLTDGGTDADGFGSAFDSDWVSADAVFSTPVGLGIRMETRLLVGYESFDEENRVQYDADGGGTARRVRRRDTVVDTSLSLVRPLGRFADVELRLRDTRHDSSTGVYDWDRQIVGTYLRFHFEP